MTCKHPQCDACYQEYVRVWDMRDEIAKEREKYRRACADLDMLHRRKQARMSAGKDTKDIDCHLDRIRRLASIHAGPLRDGSDKVIETPPCCDKRYYCVTAKEYECEIHSGFSTCCSFPEKHIYFNRDKAV